MSTNKRKILIIGHASHGKTTVAKILTTLGLLYCDSSEVAAELILPFFTNKYGYRTAAELLAQKDHYSGTARGDEIRKDMYEEIKRVNSEGGFTTIMDTAFANSDIYVGLRDTSEFIAMISRYNPVILQVDAYARVKTKESINSNPVMYLVDNFGLCQHAPVDWYVINNASTEEELHRKVTSLFLNNPELLEL